MLVTNRNSIHHAEESKEISIFLSFCVSSSSPHHLFSWLWVDLHLRTFQGREIELGAHIWLVFTMLVWKLPQKALKKSAHLILFWHLCFFSYISYLLFQSKTFSSWLLNCLSPSPFTASSILGSQVWFWNFWFVSQNVFRMFLKQKTSLW